jgi:hypothetical protein
VQLVSQGGLEDRSLIFLSNYSASLNDFFLPSTKHFLWGSWVGEHFDRSRWVEGTLYLGIVASGLALLAFAIRTQVPQQRFAIGLLLFIGGCFLVFALGTDLHWENQSVELHIPQALQGWLGKEKQTLWLPGRLMITYLPYFAKMRAIKRFAIVTLVAVSALAGLGSAWLLDRLKRPWRALVGAALLGLVFLDFYPGLYTDFFKVQPRAVDVWLASQPGQGAVVQFPFKRQEDQDLLYYSLYHHKPYLGGMFNAFSPPQYKRLTPIMEGFPNSESVATLRTLGVQYVLVEMEAYPDLASVQSYLENAGLHRLTTMDNVVVYELLPP